MRFLYFVDHPGKISLRPFNTTLFFLLFISSSSVHSQAPHDYFQQEVNYRIHVSLDDVHHMLRGNISIEYINHSPDSLHFIYFHLWPNAYKNNYTAFSKQKVENGETDFYYAADSNRGFIDSLHFLVDGKDSRLEIDSANIDIAKLYLPSSLAPGKQIAIETPFRVKIPYTYSRLGHVGQQYQISQWYPKPAVYDRFGWHPIPYLDQGEFYSEFGNFDVKITLPKNYVVGATGVLDSLNKSDDNADVVFPDSASSPEKKKSSSFPTSSKESKTLHYTARKVHDFAWFADKRYLVLESSVTLDNNQTVRTRALILPQHFTVWQHAAKFIDSAVYYYSKWVGDYEYPQATAVDGALIAGDGMEYPMITVISGAQTEEGLDRVIAHEVGHNWFYGMLGFNERDHSWMDEGINSYYENRYMQMRYPHSGILPEGFEQFQKRFDLNYSVGYQNYIYYLYFAAQRNDQPLDLPATDYTRSNYAAMIYAKTPIVFDYLEWYLGTATFDSLMQQFFQQWKFKHPYPVDMKSFYEQTTHKELDWLFNQLIERKDYLDYKLVKEDVGLQIGNSNYIQLVVKNKQEVKGPYSIAAFKDKKKMAELFYGGFNGKMTVQFPEGDYDYFRIDPEYKLPEINRNNNYLRRKGPLKKTEPLRIQWLASIDNPNRTQLFFTPLSGVNHYDGAMPGLALYNSVFFPKKVNMLLIPQIGIRSGNFVGLGSVSVPFYLQQGFLHSITFTSAARSYTFGMPSIETDEREFDQRYMRFTQSLSFNLRKSNPRSSVSQKFLYRNIFLRQQYVTTVNENTNSLPYTNSMFNTIAYYYDDRRAINPFSLKATSEFGNTEHDDYIKVFAEGNFLINYPKKKTGLGIRVFAGLFLKSPELTTYKFRLSSTTGLDDYMFDDIFLGRSEQQGFFAQQISVSDDGGFKMRTNGVTPRIGESSKWILSLNLKLPLPFFTPIFAFADGGLAPYDETSSFAGYDVFQFDAGVGITIIPKVIEVYYPIFYSEDMNKNLLSTDFYNHWYQRITFTFNIEKLNPFEKIRNISL